MTCSDLQHLLPDYIRGKLSSVEKVDIEDHLRICSACRIEMEQLQLTFARAAQESEWTPSEMYWSTLLPRIHERIEKKASQPRYAWGMRFALPLAAVVALVFFILQFIPVSIEKAPSTLSADLAQLPAEELESFIEQEAVIGLSQDTIESDDTQIVKDLLQDESQYLASIEVDGTPVLEQVSEADADRVVSIMKKKLGLTID